MADIKTALNNLAKAIVWSATYREAEAIETFVVTPTTGQRSITNEMSQKGHKASYVTIMVRSMGTATYVAIGRPGYLEERLTAIGDVLEIEAPLKCYLETSKIMIQSDTADAVIEVGGMLVPAGVLPDERV